jgi:hypothetical protein
MASNDPRPGKAALPSGEAMLHSAPASIPRVSVIVFDCEQRIRATRGSALQSHGYDSEGMLGRRMRDVMPTPVADQSKLDAAQLLIEADLAMYRAKAAGRDRIAVFAASERATAIHP